MLYRLRRNRKQLPSRYRWALRSRPGNGGPSTLAGSASDGCVMLAAAAAAPSRWSLRRRQCGLVELAGPPTTGEFVGGT